MAARKGAAGRVAAPVAMTAEERKAKLERIIRNRTREARAEIQSREDFSAVLVGGRLVNHRLHAPITIGVTAIGAAAGRSLFGDTGVLIGLAAGAGYGLFWAFLTATGGHWFDHLAIDEQGVVTSDLTGRLPDTGGKVLKVAIPGALIAFCLFLVVTLSHDLAYPPPPHCNVSPPPDKACLMLPNLADALGGPESPSPSPSASPSPVTSASPAASPSPAVSAAPNPTPRPHGKPLSVDDAIALERIVRGFQLLVATIVLLVSALFLRRMLTGKWVVAIAPVRRRDDD